MTIPQLRISPTKQLIPDSVTINPYQGDPEGSQFIISFEFYNDKLCGIEDLLKNMGKNFLKDIRKMGKSTHMTLRDNSIDCEPVHNSGDYKQLFSGLPDDVEALREHKGNSTSRIFYFYASRYLYIVAITFAHFETGKQRR